MRSEICKDKWKLLVILLITGQEMFQEIGDNLSPTIQKSKNSRRSIFMKKNHLSGENKNMSQNSINGNFLKENTYQWKTKISPQWPKNRNLKKCSQVIQITKPATEFGYQVLIKTTYKVIRPFWENKKVSYWRSTLYIQEKHLAHAKICWIIMKNLITWYLDDDHW